MSAGRISTLLCASFAFTATAAAEDAAPFVVQLRLAARGTTADVFAWRTERGIVIETSALATLGIAAPSADDEQTLLSDVPGLSFVKLEGEGAIAITCTMVCYMRQRLDLDERDEARHTVDASAAGGYLNYEGDVQWIEDDGASASGIVEAALFGSFGLIQGSWVGQTERDDDARITRLETSWTIDRPNAGVRVRLGDSIHLGANSAPVRFGGLQIGRYFGLTPSLITYPTPALTGETEAASTVELYVDGVLRAQSQIEAGPFVIDQPPVISGAGEAQLVITDILGRQQTITRPFFVSTAMLRPGLSDWSFALGAERRGFGREDSRYGDPFAALRYRRGVTESLTLEGAIEATDESATAQAAVTFTALDFGQAYVSRAVNEDGGFTTVSWYFDGRALSFGAQFEQRDGLFAPGRERDAFRQGISGNAGLDLGDYGAFNLTAAQLEFDDEPPIRTLTFAYTPDYLDGALSFRLAHFEREESELAAGISFSFSLTGDVSAHVSAENDDRGTTYRAGAQRAVEPERFGWRARASAGGEHERVELAAMVRGPLGDTQAEVGYAGDRGGVRVRHAGSIGWIDNMAFAGRRIDGAFALVDVGAPDVSVSRNQLDVGETGGDGRHLITNLRAYDRNVISINPDDLPVDRAPTSPNRFVTPAAGSGVVVRFSDARERVAETRVAFADGELPARGAILVRTRDGERFPIGTGGRVVVQGAQDGDIVHLINSGCDAAADEAAVRAGLTLQCAALS